MSVDVLKNYLSNLSEPPKPVWKRFKTNDATIEKIQLLLSENPRGLLVFRDELIGLLRSFDKLGRETDRAFYLESWSGTSSHTTDRISRDTSHAENICLSLFGTTQPDKILKYLYATFNGDNDGLVQRFQLLVYPDSQPWKLVDRTPNIIARNNVFGILKKLSQTNFISLGATKNENDPYPFFSLDDQAQELYDRWITNLEVNKLRNSHISPLLIEHISKFRSLMPSLALIFHLIEIISNDNADNTNVISAENVDLACAWCNYLESHAKRIYGLITDPTTLAATAIANIIKKGKLKNRFTWRDLNRGNWSFLNKRTIVEEGCDELIEKNWLKKTTTKRGNTAYLINPKIKKDLR